ncbi:MAG: hypothetical protein RJB55_1320 [Verrucomicrobiota bacterium]|jgi:hypothetical protein
MPANVDNTAPLARWIKIDGSTVEGPAQDLMKAFAEAGFAGRLVPVTEVPRLAAVTPAAPALRPGVDVDPEAERRIKAAEAFLASRGFAAPPSWFAAGTEMLPEGRARFGSLAKRHEDLPAFRDAAGAVIDQIRAESRRDVQLGDARALRLLPDGTLTRGKAPIALEPFALKGLISRFPKAFPGAWQLVSLLDPATRAEVINAQLSRLGEWYDDDDRNLRLRLRNLAGSWQAFAAVSPSYMPMDADKVLATYTEALDGLRLPDPRGAVAYNGETTDVTIRATWHAPASFRPSVGDVFESGISSRTNDAGGGAHRGGNTFTRIVCINCTTVEFGENLRRVHKGSRTQDLTQVGLARIAQDVRGIVEQAGDAARYFLDSWGVLRDTPISEVRIGGKKHADPRDALRALVSSGDLDADVARDTMVEALLRGFDKEPGDTLADAFNAVTRAAHEGLLDEVQRWRVERAAGALLPVLAQRAAEA